jgi:hypothetical protein
MQLVDLLEGQLEPELNLAGSRNGTRYSACIGPCCGGICEKATLRETEVWPVQDIEELAPELQVTALRERTQSERLGKREIECSYAWSG